MGLKLSEAHVTRQCIDFLEAEHWKCIRLQSGLFQRPNGKERIRIGEAGMPDWICVREHHYFFLEMKATKGRLSRAQKNWLMMAEQRGYPVCVCSGLDELREWMNPQTPRRFRWVEDLLS